MTLSLLSSPIQYILCTLFFPHLQAQGIPAFPSSFFLFFLHILQLFFSGSSLSSPNQPLLSSSILPKLLEVSFSPLSSFNESPLSSFPVSTPHVLESPLLTPLPPIVILHQDFLIPLWPSPPFSLQLFSLHSPFSSPDRI